MHAQMYTLSPAWESSVKRWCAWLVVGGKSQRTIRTRRGQVRGTVRRLESKEPRDVTYEQIVELYADHEWSLDHRRGLRTSLNSYFEWAIAAGICESNPASELPAVPQAKPAPRPAPDWLWEQLQSAPPRELMMIRLAGEAGLRRSEVAQVHKDHLVWDGVGYGLLVRGKGDKQRVVPLTDALATEIRLGAKRWAPDDRSGFLFPGQINGHLSGDYVGHLIGDLMPKGWSIHKLRHRYATRGYAGTRNLRAVQMALGHASVATTERYTAVLDHEIRAVTNAASGF